MKSKGQQTGKLAQREAETKLGRSEHEEVFTVMIRDSEPKVYKP